VTALPSPGKVLKLQFVYAIGPTTNTAMNVFHFSYTGGPPGASDVVTLAALFGTNFPAYFGTNWPASTHLTEIICTDLSGPGGFQGASAQSIVGAGPTAGETANQCMVIQFLVPARYRGGHPRIYLPGPSTPNLQDATSWSPTVASAQATTWGSYMNTMANKTAGTTVLNQHVAVSYYQGGVWTPDQHGNYHRIPTKRPTPLVLPVSGYVGKTRVGSQRKRLVA
jgi:hypothetical protein